MVVMLLMLHVTAWGLMVLVLLLLLLMDDLLVWVMLLLLVLLQLLLRRTTTMHEANVWGSDDHLVASIAGIQWHIG